LAIVLAQIGELAGLAVGATVLLNVLFAGYSHRQFSPKKSSSSIIQKIELG
jgi:hypothetical protein